MRKAAFYACGFLLCLTIVSAAEPIDATWKMFRRGEHERNAPRDIPGDAKDVKLKHTWRSGDDFYWFITDVAIPETIDGKPTRGWPVGVQFNCAAGGDVYVNDVLQSRYDNDHPALVLVADSAEPGQRVRLAVHVYGHLGGEDNNEFSEASWVLIDPKRVRDPLVITADPRRMLDPLPNGLIGLSQGAGMADYEDATAAKLRDAGFKWFRMDNVFTQAVKAAPDGGYTYDFADLERRVAFMQKIGADPILCVSYMPEAFDAVPDKDRHSAPKDYTLWEDLCYRAAKHLLNAKLRVTWWEVWNETNAGWIKPGPNDTGTPEFEARYIQALGNPDAKPAKDDVRLLEAYLKLYTATAKGILRADPNAKIGGPCLASGPYEREEHHYAVRGKVFARALMRYCQDKNLPLDFITWHEYFHPADVIADEARTFRKYLDEFPKVRKRVKSFMLTEWSVSWWHDRPQDNELGSAWCADNMIRAILPEKIDRPCFFYVKDNDSNLRGGWALLIQNNVPKPVYNVCKMFNAMTGVQLTVTGGDEDVCALAAWDARKNRLPVIVVNYRYRYSLQRKVKLSIPALPRSLADGRWRQYLIDATHSNVWHDRSRAELEVVNQGTVTGTQFSLDMPLLANSVTLIELEGK